MSVRPFPPDRRWGNVGDGKLDCERDASISSRRARGLHTVFQIFLKTQFTFKMSLISAIKLLEEMTRKRIPSYGLKRAAEAYVEEFDRIVKRHAAGKDLAFAKTYFAAAENWEVPVHNAPAGPAAAPAVPTAIVAPTPIAPVAPSAAAAGPAVIDPAAPSAAAATGPVVVVVVPAPNVPAAPAAPAADAAPTAPAEDGETSSSEDDDQTDIEEEEIQYGQVFSPICILPPIPEEGESEAPTSMSRDQETPSPLLVFLDED